jgi:hypothetical protein
MAEQGKERFEQVGLFNQYLTQVDLELHPEWVNAFKSGDRSLFERILYEFGADLRYGYEEDVAHVRARRSDLKPYEQVQYGMLIRFKERTDKWWVDNMMDITDIVDMTKDSIRATGMREVLNSTSHLYEAMKQEAAKNIIVVEIACNDGSPKEDKD